MLRGLDITDMLIIDRLTLAFQPGLNVLTGETGAGKSILLDALGFVLGWRGRADLVRQGAEFGEVVAQFDLGPDHPARDVLAEAGLPVADELLLRRVNGRDGRKTAWINDKRASAEMLRVLSETLLELHGQHDDRGLLDPRGHLAILDEFGGLADIKQAVRAAWTAQAAARRALRAAQQHIEAVREEEDYLRHSVEELSALAPEIGEEAQLDARRRLMQGAERTRADMAKAHHALGSNGAEGAMTDALRWLEGAQDQADGQLDGALAALGRALAELDLASDGVAAALDHLSFNPSDLEDTETRLFAIRGMARKHDVAADALPDLLARYAARLETLDAGGVQLAELTHALTETEADYADAAQALTAARQSAARALDAAVMAELAPLKMERAVFQTVVDPDQPGAEGQDSVTFCVATNPGAPAGPLGKIASGGELSRFLLALKVCLSRGEADRTMIFDEIDRGVGGATADAVGRRLAQLAVGGQVLVVTHSPQVAALGAHHWRVEKSVSDGMTTSRVVPLTPADRVDEIARMLSGDIITSEARAAARALLTPEATRD